MSTKQALPHPKTWKPVHGATCLRCCERTLKHVKKLGKTDDGAELVLSEHLECECGWKHRLASTFSPAVGLVRIARPTTRKR